jgi:hypothetical protein
MPVIMEAYRDYIREMIVRCRSAGFEIPQRLIDEAHFLNVPYP